MPDDALTAPQEPLTEEPLLRQARLQQALRQQLAAYDQLPEGASTTAAAEQVLAAGEALIACEAELPALLDAGPHQNSRLVLLGGGAVAVLAGLGLAAGVAGGDVGAWWGFAVPALLVAGVLVLRTPVQPLMAGHRRQRPAAVAVAAGALLTWVVALVGPGRSGTAWTVVTATALVLLGVGALRAVAVAPPIGSVRTGSGG